MGIHSHLFAIWADTQPRKNLRAMDGGESQEDTDAIATWAWGALSLTALRP